MRPSRRALRVSWRASYHTAAGGESPVLRASGCSARIAAMKLALSRAKELLATTTSDPHLVVHATNVRVCIDGMKPYAAETGLLPKA